MILSEINIYEFLRDKFKFEDSDAKKYAKEAVLAEEKLRNEIKDCITTEIKSYDFATKKDLLEMKMELKGSINSLEGMIYGLEATMQKSFAQMTRWVVTLFATIAGIALAVARLLF